MNDVDLDPDYVYNLSKKSFSQDAIMWFNVLSAAIETYLCGLDETFKIGMYSRRDEVVEWIHGIQDYQYCFNELWLMFYDSDPEFVKKVLAKKYNQRYKMYLKEIKRKPLKNTGGNLAQDKNSNGRGTKTDISCPDIDGRTFKNCESDVWVESLIFER